MKEIKRKNEKGGDGGAAPKRRKKKQSKTSFQQQSSSNDGKRRPLKFTGMCKRENVTTWLEKSKRSFFREYVQHV